MPVMNKDTITNRGIRGRVAGKSSPCYAFYNVASFLVKAMLPINVSS